MKYTFAQISDTHLGYKSGRFKSNKTEINLREQDGYDAYHQVINEIVDYKNKFGLDAVICTGDLFHSPEPKINTIVEAKKGLQKLYKENIVFYNIAGNHDATDSVRDIPSNGVLDLPELNLFSYTEPYVKKEIFPGVIGHFVSHHGYLEQAKTFESVNPEPDKFNLLITHGSVFDSSINGILHTEGEPREVVISEDLMNKDWDYTIMGHIHERGWVHSKDKLTDTENRKQFYAGSLIRRGFADKYCKLGRGWTLWEIDTEEKTMTPKFFTIPQRFQKDILIFCKDKSSEEIEQDLINEFKKINFDGAPILRTTFVDMSTTQKLSIDWKQFIDYTKKCLSYSTKIKTKEEIKKEIKNNTFSFDLITAYTEFWELLQDDYPEEVKFVVRDLSKKYLQLGQEKVTE